MRKMKEINNIVSRQATRRYLVVALSAALCLLLPAYIMVAMIEVEGNLIICAVGAGAMFWMIYDLFLSEVNGQVEALLNAPASGGRGMTREESYRQGVEYIVLRDFLLDR